MLTEARAPSPHRWLAWWLPAMLAAIFVHGPMPLYSTRTLAVGWDMWRLGEWLVPHINGAAYSHKTPLLYWLYHAGWSVFGVTDIWPRVLHVGIATAMIALAARLAARLYPSRDGVARVTPWVVMGLGFFVMYALQLMFDVLLAVWVLLALLALLYRGLEQPRPHWALFALAVALGLLTKGPVMLLHVAFPVLLAPWWSTTARAAPWRWYGAALLAIAAALVAFAAWVVPAAMLGGSDYADALLFKQTAGRLVQSFDHHRTWWWYLAMLPLIAFPWLAWPTAWRAAIAARDGVWQEPGTRFLVAWLVPSLVAFSAISGKQAYYLVPPLAGFAILVARVIESRRAHGTPPSRAFGFGLGFIAFGLAIIALPLISARVDPASIWAGAHGPIRFAWGGAIVAIGIAMLWRARDAAEATRRLAVATLGVVFFAHLQFTAIAWPRYDLAPAAAVLTKAAREGRPIANLSSYEGQFHFIARLDTTIAEMQFDQGRVWALAHPDGIIVQYPHDPWRGEGNPPLLAQPFRATWLEIWTARDWLAAFHAHLIRLPLDVAQRSESYEEAKRVTGRDAPDDR